MKMKAVLQTALVVIVVMAVVYRIEPLKDLVTADTGFF